MQDGSGPPTVLTRLPRLQTRERCTGLYWKQVDEAVCKSGERIEQFRAALV